MRASSTSLLTSRPLRRVGGYTEYAPPRDLRGHVRCVWTYRCPVGHEPEVHRVLPHVGVTVTVRFDCRDPGEEPQVLLLGPVHTPRTFRPEPGLVMEAVELRPEWSRAVLGVAPEEHVGGCLPVTDLRLRSTDDIRRAVDETGSALPSLLRWIDDLRWAARVDSATRLAHFALMAVEGRSEPGAEAPVAAAASAAGVSVRHLRRAVRSVVGSSPKFLHRLCRFNALVREADTLADPAWAGLAAGHGFYDQAHLIQECRSLAGVTPTALHRERSGQRVPFFQYPDPAVL